MPKVMLIILDGLGLSFEKKGNPLFEAKTPMLDYLLETSPHLNLSASAEAVGLSWGEVGNSEVGHSNIGTGEVIWQDLPRIDSTIANRSFYRNKVILGLMSKVKKNKSSLHLVGLISDGGVHSHLNHLLALLEIARRESINRVYLHAFTDGRDTPPKSAKKFIEKIETKTKESGVGKISTISGRFYAMDRDDHWERIEKAYQVMAGDSSNVKKSSLDILKQGYAKGQNDETIEPAMVGLGEKTQFLNNNDGVIIFNFRADRAREITLALGQKDFKQFKRKKIDNLALATMTPYETDWKLEIETIFGALSYKNPLADILAQNKISQLHLAETEKYAHVTYFFNGGREKKLLGEEHICIPSPRVDDYSQKPEMSLSLVVSELLAQINKNFDFIVVNFANPDMIGHTGDYKAAQIAISAVDKNLKFLLSKAKNAGYDIFITADHGNVEQMINLETGEIDKEHTINPVFLIRVKNKLKNDIKFSVEEHRKIWSKASLDPPKGVLADITSTLCQSLGLALGSSFSGQSLIDLL